MALISNVFAFAAQNPDYWLDLLSESNYPVELSDAEKRGMTAARAHIDNAVVELLHLCATHFFDMLGNAKAVSKTFHETKTAKKRLIKLNAPVGTGTRLYRLEFALWGDAGSGTAVQLWASLVAKKKTMPSILTNLARATVGWSVSDYHISASPIELVQDRSFDDLANEAAVKMKELVKAVR